MVREDRALDNEEIRLSEPGGVKKSTPGCLYYFGFLYIDLDE